MNKGMEEARVPHHIGFIMDGNRRFSKRLMMKPWKGHEWGAKKVRKVFDWCKEYGISEITLYTFSIQNFNRPKKEFDYLMDIFRRNFRRLEKDKQITESGIRVNVIGRLWLFPKDIQEMMHKVMEKTKHNKDYIANFAMAYGGQEEVIDATKRIAQKIKEGSIEVDDINQEVFRQYLYTSDEPDLIIRTGGEQRTSNFLAFQSAYSEWFFVEKMWPEFSKHDFNRILKEYTVRHRRFGK